ncbi:MAG: Gfo/Idh/MocA family oxidoreductase, partial [Acidobacteriales bacterium]|nr:Gfo/Idh/MocA family oxidoreductase [Terriglobales bacterium]
MSKKRFKVGIVGLDAGGSWASRAHLPALRALSEDYEVIGVANRSLASAEKAAAATGLPNAFANLSEMLSSPDIDIVVVTVRVQYHLEVVSSAIAAGKHVYCEWPLGNGLAEAQEVAALAQAKGVLGIAGLQARVAPEIVYVKQLICDGFVGEPLSTSIVATGLHWGASIAAKNDYEYTLDPKNGATMLTIP